MKVIQVLANFAAEDEFSGVKDKEVKELFNDGGRQLIKIKLKNGAVLSKHKAQEPITVFCLAGTGVFRAGSNLEEEQNLQAGTLITLEAGVEHEVVAEPELSILVTKFKKY